MKLSHKLALLLALFLLLMTSAINLAIYTNKHTDLKVDALLNTSLPMAMAILSLDTHISYARHYLIKYVNATETSKKKMYELQLHEISKQIKQILETNKDIFASAPHKERWEIFSNALAALINSQKQVLKRHKSNNNALIYLDTYYAKDYINFADAMITMRTYVTETMDKGSLNLQDNLLHANNILLTIFYLPVFACIIIIIYIFKLFTDSAHMASKELQAMTQYICDNNFKACHKIAQEHANSFMENILNKLEKAANLTRQKIETKQQTLNKVEQALTQLLHEKKAAQDTISKTSNIAAILQNLIKNLAIIIPSLKKQIKLAKDLALAQSHEMKQYTTNFDQLALETPNITQYVRIVTDFSLHSDSNAKDVKIEMLQTIKNIKQVKDASIDLTNDMEKLHALAKSLKKHIKPLNMAITKTQRLALSNSNNKQNHANAQGEGANLHMLNHIVKTKTLADGISRIIINIEKEIRSNLHSSNKSLKYIDITRSSAVQAAKIAKEIQGAVSDTKDKLKESKNVLKAYSSKSTLLKISLMQLNTLTTDNLDNISALNHAVINVHTLSVNLQHNIQQLKNC